MAVHGMRTARGALAGAAAAGVWAAQQPLDKRLTGSAYDDCELLGRAVVRDRGWYPVGLALHLANGAVFGAVYAVAAPNLPGPRWAHGPLTAMVENFGAWPLGRMVDRFHPARSRLPALAGNRRALVQATWRHLVFGVVLGELERRLNPEPEPEHAAESYFSSNGHGRLEDTVAVERA